MRNLLFVDNDPDFLKTRAQFLEIAGYRVIKAHTLTDAKRYLNETWFPLVILDLRIADDDDEKDFSGLELAKMESCTPISKIILSGYLTHEIVRELLRLQRSGHRLAVNILSKEEGPEVLIDAVDQAFARDVRINWDLNIEWKAHDRYSLVNFIEPGIESEHLHNRVEELGDLFRRLFYEDNQIRINHLLWQYKGRVGLSIFTFNEGATPETFLITCGLRKQLIEEGYCYNEFAPKAPCDHSTVLKGQSETTHFAANVYALAGVDFENVHTLVELYRTGPEKTFTLCLNILFQKTLADWHEEKRAIEEKRTLAELYRQRLRLIEAQFSRAEFSERVQTIIHQIPILGQEIKQEEGKLIIRFGRQRYAYPDPAHMLYHAFETRHPVMLIKTPGYLSGDNILTAADGRTWLTDFGEAGYAPLLWNFVTMESEIRFDWIETSDLQQIFAIERCLITGDFSNLDIRDIDARLRKPLRAIQTIRKLAYGTAGKNPQQYHIGIFFNAAKRIADFNPSAHLMPNELARLAHAVIAMAMIADIVSQEDDPITTTSQKPHEITVDKTNCEVWVEGEKKEVAPQDFEILLYLYERPNQLCKREDVFKHVYGREYNDSEDYLLNTAISRLREKIEPEKERPLYLITKRGVGYILKIHPEE